MPTTAAARLAAIEARLSSIEALLIARVPVADIRAAMEESSATAESVASLSEAAPLLSEQLEGIATTLAALASDEGTREALHNTLFYTQQLGEVTQGTRSDIVAFRLTILRQCMLLDQVLRARVADEEWEQGRQDRRRAGERRRAG